MGINVPLEFTDRKGNQIIVKKYEVSGWTDPGEVNIAAIDVKNDKKTGKSTFKVIGSLTYWPDTDDDRYMYFSTIGVLPQARGRGIGKILVGIVVEHSYQDGKGIKGDPLPESHNFYQILMDRVIPLTNKIVPFKLDNFLEPVDKNEPKEFQEIGRLTSFSKVVVALARFGFFSEKRSCGKILEDTSVRNQLDDAFGDDEKLEEHADNVLKTAFKNM